MPDREIEAIGQLARILEPLNEDERTRVLAWARDKFKISGSSRPEDDPSRAIREFEHFADLVDAFNPTTDVESALVGGYWYQCVEGNDSFDGATVNNALKDVGHGVDNITRAMDGLQNRTPALARQLSKSGRSKQARKTYKLTTAGASEVKSRIEAVS